MNHSITRPDRPKRLLSLAVLLVGTMGAAPPADPAAPLPALTSTAMFKPPHWVVMVQDGFLWIDAEDFARLRRLAAGYPVRAPGGLRLSPGRPAWACRSTTRPPSRDAQAGQVSAVGPGEELVQPACAGPVSGAVEQAGARRRSSARPTARPGSGSRPASSTCRRAGAAGAARSDRLLRPLRCPDRLTTDLGYVPPERLDDFRKSAAG